jgi:hypothetical protein
VDLQFQEKFCNDDSSKVHVQLVRNNTDSQHGRNT